jgi:hypothetical protein
MAEGIQDLVQLLDMIGGKTTPPAMGGEPPQPGTPYPLGAMGAGTPTALAALSGIGMMQMMDSYRKLVKSQSSVGMSLNKPTEVSPMASGIGPADLQQRAQMMASQQSPQGPPGGMPGGMPGMMSPGGGPQMPPGQSPGPGQLMAMLAQMRGGGGM